MGRQPFNRNNQHTKHLPPVLAHPVMHAVPWCRTLSFQVESWFKLPLRKQEPRAPPAPGSPASGAPLGPLIPELAHLQWAEEIAINANKSTVYAGIPTAWGLPGAFPRLRQ